MTTGPKNGLADDIRDYFHPIVFGQFSKPIQDLVRACISKGSVWGTFEHTPSLCPSDPPGKPEQWVLLVNVDEADGRALHALLRAEHPGPKMCFLPKMMANGDQPAWATELQNSECKS